MYQSLDPEKNRLVVSRDVVFEEHLPWEWGRSIDTSLSDDTFIVEYQSTDKNPTTVVTEAEFDFDGVGTPSSSAVGPHVAEGNTPGSAASPIPTAPLNVHGGSPLASPSEETHGAPLKLRSLQDI